MFIYKGLAKYDCSESKINYLINKKNKYEKMHTMTGNVNIKLLSVLNDLDNCEFIISMFKSKIKNEIKKFEIKNKNIYTTKFNEVIEKINFSNKDENILTKLINIYKNYANKIENNIGKGVELYNNEIKEEYQKDVDSMNENVTQILLKYDSKLNKNYIKNIKFKFKKYLTDVENNIGKGVDLYTNYVNIQLKQEYKFFDENIKFFNTTKLNIKKNEKLIDGIINSFNNFKTQIESNIGLGVDLSINFIESQLDQEKNFFD